MDASRCISYLTIEHRGDIPPSLASKMGQWVFGCDVCQEVCPFNAKAPVTDHLTIRAHGPDLPLDAVASWDQATCRSVLKGTAMTRATLEMLQRNALIAAGNAARS